MYRGLGISVFLFFAVLSLFSQPSAGSGLLDGTFSNNGYEAINFNGAMADWVQAVVQEESGKYLVLHRAKGGEVPDAVVYRLNENGTVQTTFERLDGFDPVDLALQSDGKVIVAGSTTNGNFAVARFNVDGTLDDTSFGMYGVAVYDVGGADTTTAVAVQADDKIVVCGNTGTNVAIVRFNSGGSIDPTFNGGQVVIDFANDSATDVTLQPDGKILVAGTVGYDFLVLRLTTTGLLDVSFNGTGYALTDLGGTSGDRGHTVLVQPDQKIAVAGITNSGDNDFAVVRYNSNGSLDATFGSGGFAVFDFPSSRIDSLLAASLQADGKFVLIGTSKFAGSDFDFALARLTTAGVLDATFGTGGLVLTPLGLSDDSARAGIILSDGRILAGGYSTVNDDEGAVVRYLSNGAVDTTFGNSGIYLNGTTGQATDGANALVQEHDGHLIAVGTSVDATGCPRFALTRYTQDGDVDTSFGADGQLILENTGEAVAAFATWDKIYVAGIATDPAGDKDFVVAVLENGVLDTWFGGTGIVKTRISSGDDIPYAIADDGSKFVVGGASCDALYCKFVLVRYSEDGTLDTAFDSDGILLVDKGAESRITSIYVDTNYKIAVAGCIDCNTDNSDFALMRFTSQGAFDTTFGTGGYVRTTLPGKDGAVSLVPGTANGTILAGGYWTDSGGLTQFGAIRFHYADGTIDTTHGVNGLAGTAFDASAQPVTPLSMDSYSIQWAAMGGSITNSGQKDFVLVRFDEDGNLDTSFSDDGIATVSFEPGQNDEIRHVWTAPDRKLYATGLSFNWQTGFDFLIARVTSDDSLLWDNFDDGVMNWAVTKGSWSETAGALTVPVSPKAIIYTPAIWTPSGESACIRCAMEMDVSTPAGLFSKVFIQGWYQNGGTRVDLMMNTSRNKWVLKQRVGGVVVASAKASKTISPDTTYHVEMFYDGSHIHVVVDGETVIKMAPKVGIPDGKIGFKVKNTGLSVYNINVF